MTLGFWPKQMKEWNCHCQLQIGNYQEHCQWLNNKAFHIYIYWDWTPCCYSWWPSITPEGVQSRVRHSVLQGIWWDRSLDSWMLLGTYFMISILHLLYLGESESCLVMSNTLLLHGLCSPPGQNTGVVSLYILQGIFPTQVSNTGLPHCRQTLYLLNHQGSPIIL